MSVPFGGHPKLGDVVEWLGGIGCKIETKIRTRAQSGQPYEVIEVTAPAGGVTVPFVGRDMEERLAPSMVAYIQRRLGVKTPFPATPEQPDPETSFVQVPDENS